MVPTSIPLNEGYNMTDLTIGLDCDFPISFQLMTEHWANYVDEAVHRPNVLSILKANPSGRFEIDLIHTSTDSVFLHTITHITDRVTYSKSTFVTDPASFLPNGGTTCCFSFLVARYQSSHLLLDKFGFLLLYQLFLLYRLMLK